jgi:two-component system response regulator FixJ
VDRPDDSGEAPAQRATPQSLRHVHVVDDDAVVCTALGRLLRAAGYAVATFVGGPDFVARKKDHVEPDCIVLDVVMPRLSGLAIQRLLVEQRSGAALVLLTGRAEIGDIEPQALKDGAFAVLRKPVDETLLLDTLAGAIRVRDASFSGTAPSRGRG